MEPDVDPVRRDHVSGDPGQAGDFRRGRAARLLEGRDEFLKPTIQLGHPELDDLIFPVVEADRLHVKDIASSAASRLGGTELAGPSR